jgi:hypothetical protein
MNSGIKPSNDVNANGDPFSKSLGVLLIGLKANLLENAHVADEVPQWPTSAILPDLLLVY